MVVVIIVMDLLGGYGHMNVQALTFIIKPTGEHATKQAALNFCVNVVEIVAVVIHLVVEV